MTDQDVLSTAYRDVVAAVSDLDTDEEWLPTGCAGWSVRDLVFHLRGDAYRALVALSSPAGTPPDTDAVSYWTHWRPGTDGARLNLRWDDVTYARMGTGRAAPSEHDRAVLGPLAERFPLFG
jgi:hypothetical protein